MANLKELRTRIKTIQSTRKITSAMKLVAGAKLRRAQEQVEQSRPYASLMSGILGNLWHRRHTFDGSYPLLSGNGSQKRHLLIVATSDRGLCGAFNASITRAVRRDIKRLQDEGKEVLLYFIGRKGRDALRKDYGHLAKGFLTDHAKVRVYYGDAENVSIDVSNLFHDGIIDTCAIIFNAFKSILTQVVTTKQLIPFTPDEAADLENEDTDLATHGVYIYEPGEEELLKALLPKNLAIQIFQALLENQASEHGARMAAMDNATRNASDMIKRVQLVYNRTRQAYITKELIEIISGAEAV